MATWGSGDLTAEFDALFQLSVPKNLTRLLRFQFRSSIAWLPSEHLLIAACAFLVPEIISSQHCCRFSTPARTICRRVLYQFVDGVKTGAPPPRYPGPVLVTK